MTEIHSINLNAQSLSNAGISGKSASKKEESTEERIISTDNSEKNTSSVSEKDVFSFMASGAMISRTNIKLSPAALVARYNTPEQIERISTSMLEADKAVDDEEMANLEKEFADVPEFQNMSLANKRAFALAVRMNRLEGNPSISTTGEAIGNMFDSVTSAVVEGLTEM